MIGFYPLFSRVIGGYAHYDQDGVQYVTRVAEFSFDGCSVSRLTTVKDGRIYGSCCKCSLVWNPATLEWDRS